jgi:hypothetical protein
MKKLETVCWWVQIFLIFTNLGLIFLKRISIYSISTNCICKHILIFWKWFRKWYQMITFANNRSVKADTQSLVIIYIFKLSFSISRLIFLGLTNCFFLKFKARCDIKDFAIIFNFIILILTNKTIQNECVT